MTPKELNEIFMKLVGGYTAFVAALLVAVIAKGGSFPHTWLASLLLAVSLPSLVALILLDFNVRVRQGRKRSMFRGLAAGMGFIPSLACISIMIGQFSTMAGVLFIAFVVFWYLVIDAVVFLGHGDPESEV